MPGPGPGGKKRGEAGGFADGAIGASWVASTWGCIAMDIGPPIANGKSRIESSLGCSVSCGTVGIVPRGVSEQGCLVLHELSNGSCGGAVVAFEESLGTDGVFEDPLEILFGMENFRRRFWTALWAWA